MIAMWNRRTLIVVLVVLLVVGAFAAPKVIEVVRSKTEANRLAGLLPNVRAALERTRRDLDAQGIKTLVGETLRDAAMQADRVAGGKSATVNSWHLLGRAIDLYPYGPDGKADLAGKYIDRFRVMHQIATRHGFRGLAFNADGTQRYITTSAGKIWDGGHIEFPEGMTFAQAANQQANKAVV
jgi:type II secretory pathway pseudopilin PulG